METGEAAIRRADVTPGDSEWRTFWHGHSVESEIAMADFYGLRHVLLKFLPRHGAIVEAGCGLGRYVFYLRSLGFRAIGCELLLPALAAARGWALRAAPDAANAFSAADVRRLPFRDRSLSGYVSLGVVEHFREGPDAAVAEAHRVLCPGGIAIVEVPSARAFDLSLHRAKRAVGSVLGRQRAPSETLHEEPLAPRELAAALERAGFLVLFCDAVDLIYPAWSLGVDRRWYPLLHEAERHALLRRRGGLAVAVGLKVGSAMACFVCGAHVGMRHELAVALCDRCRAALPFDVVAAFTPANSKEIRWGCFDPPASGAGGSCIVCGGHCMPDPTFGDWGFDARVCARCVRLPRVNLTLACRALKRVWRPRVPALTAGGVVA
jgi:SAM-dependent methyltransferase